MTAFLTKDDILEKLMLNKAQLTAFGVHKISLFGSYASNQATTKSDVDLLVDIHQNKKNAQLSSNSLFSGSSFQQKSRTDYKTIFKQAYRTAYFKNCRIYTHSRLNFLIFNFKILFQHLL